MLEVVELVIVEALIPKFAIETLNIGILRRLAVIGERVIGTIRRECLDWMIPMSEAHLRSILLEWTAHYNPIMDVLTVRWLLVCPILPRN
jgi:hypothetical protein